MDKYSAIRALTFPALASGLGLDVSKFKLKGKDWAGPCPAHKGKNANSFRYEAETGKYHCFSCGAKGKGGIDLCMTLRSYGFKQAVEFLESVRPTNEPPQTQKTPISDSVASEDTPAGELKPYSGSYEKFKVDCDWLNQRVPDKAIRERFGVFQYRNDKRRSQYNGRVLIPFQDIDGKLWGYMGRDITGTEGVAKYLVPAGFPKSRFLFGAAQLKADTSRPLPLKYVYLVESCWTVMRFASLGFPAVASFGWSVSEEQAELLATLAKGCIYLPDRNKRAESGAVCHLLSGKLWLRSPELPEAIHDPEHMGLEQIRAL